MLDKFLKKRKNVYLFALIAIIVESFSSVCLKYAGNYSMFSVGYIVYFMNAIVILGIYAVMWQIILEHLPLTTAYLRKGISYIIAYLWAFLFFHEKISIMQWIGTLIIFAGMFISQSDQGRKDEK